MLSAVEGQNCQAVVHHEKTLTYYCCFQILLKQPSSLQFLQVRHRDLWSRILSSMQKLSNKSYICSLNLQTTATILKAWLVGWGYYTQQTRSQQLQ